MGFSRFFRLIVLGNNFFLPPFFLEYRASLYTRLEAKRLKPTDENKRDLDSADGDIEKQVTRCGKTCHAKRFLVHVLTATNVTNANSLSDINILQTVLFSCHI